MQQHHPITGDWIPCDDTSNRLELAQTTEPGLIALRDSHDPDQQVFATPGQLQSLVQAAGQGRLDRLLGPGSARR